MVKKKVTKKKVSKKRVIKKKVIRKKSSVKRVVKRTIKKKAAKAKTSGVKKPKETVIGTVTHYFPHVNAAAVKVLKNSINVGDEIYLKGHTTDFKEKIESIQLDRSPIREGKKGQEIGLLVSSRVRIGDSVYKV